ncbi:MAG: gamma-glutamylcyclotransferase [Syntrophomonas sp.]|nr:gamma-glutamylcyclotransferase [Syntrophomonas sp.]
MIKVFVSGSLMTNGRYHQYYLQGKIFLGKGFINEYKRYILGGLDGILPEKGERVQGEVYEVDPAALAKLDFLYNHGTYFTRRIVDVELENGETLQADVYIWNGSV